jgi:hypothetical protein
MTAQREPSAHEISHDIDTLRDRVDTLEREVDQRLDKMDQKMDEITRSSVTRHAEVMGQLANIGKASELADQRNSIQIEGLLASLKENTKRTDALEASKVDTLQKLLDERKESGRHWFRYAVAAAFTIAVAVAGAILGHLWK